MADMPIAAGPVLMAGSLGMPCANVSAAIITQKAYETLLRSGVPVHVVSARAGHSKPSVTLDMYSHLLGGEDNDAAKQAEAILLRVLK